MRQCNRKGSNWIGIASQQNDRTVSLLIEKIYHPTIAPHDQTTTFTCGLIQHKTHWPCRKVSTGNLVATTKSDNSSNISMCSRTLARADLTKFALELNNQSAGCVTLRDHRA